MALMRFIRRQWHLSLLIFSALAALAWATLAPIYSVNRDQLFEIPKGTYDRRMAGDKVEILPEKIDLMLGVKDVLLLRNSDTVPQIFGPMLIMPGQDFRLPFELASDYQFACTAHASGQMSVIVKPMPDAGWARLQWRLRMLRKSIPFTA